MFQLYPLTYEQRLNKDADWALGEGSMHFEQKSAVQQALRSITAQLDALQVDYAVAGGMALFSHGFRRFTEDIDILVTRDGLKTIHDSLEGHGYVPPFRGSKNLRDAENGVRIEFLITGEYPGDGKPKPVAFPTPHEVAMERDGIRYLNLPTLIELKLASGMSNADRLKDLADVQELIKLFALSPGFQDSLNPYVRGKYQELRQAVMGNAGRYAQIRQGAPTTDAIASLDDLILHDAQAAVDLKAMKQDGVFLDVERSRPARGYYVLVTHDADVATRHGLHDEAEILYEE